MKAQTIPDLVNKQECTCFVLLITGYFKSGFKVFKLNGESLLSLFKAAILSFFFSSVCFAFSA